jgi:hypothetical protein
LPRQSVPFKAESLQGSQNPVCRAGHLPGPIEILDPQQPASLVGARIQEARYRREERT